MTGYLSSQGIRCAEKRVGQSLKRVNPVNHARRQSNTYRQTNPIPYTADYFGQKVHIDQNEKLVMFGITHVCAIDDTLVKLWGLLLCQEKIMLLFMSTSTSKSMLLHM